MGRKVIRDVEDIIKPEEKSRCPRGEERDRLRGNQLGQAITDAILAGGLVKGEKKRSGR